MTDSTLDETVIKRMRDFIDENGFTAYPDFSTLKVEDLSDEAKKDMLEIAESEEFKKFAKSFKNRKRANRYTYRIDKRPAENGGGYRLRLLEDGEEVGGGTFPRETTDRNAFQDAENTAIEWLNSRKNGGEE